MLRFEKKIADVATRRIAASRVAFRLLLTPAVDLPRSTKFHAFILYLIKTNLFAVKL